MCFLLLQYLGNISAPSTLSYLDSGVVFVGSNSNDSQLVRLQSRPIPPSNDCYVEVLDYFTNLGPIVDFCVMDLDRQGQCQVMLKYIFRDLSSSHSITFLSFHVGLSADSTQWWVFTCNCTGHNCCTALLPAHHYIILVDFNRFCVVTVEECVLSLPKSRFWINCVLWMLWDVSTVL